MASSTKKWSPLESNPEVLNAYAAKIGLDLCGHAFCDVFGLDEDMLSMVPQPVIALLMCYPITEETEAAAKQEDNTSKGAESVNIEGHERLYFMKQTIGNACGTIALLHIAGNAGGVLKTTSGSFLEQFLSSTETLDPSARGKYLEDPPEGCMNIEAAHQAAALEGNSSAPGDDEEVDLHFVAFVNHGGRLMQLDGRRPHPVDCGPTTAESFLSDAAEIVRKFAEMTKSISFNLIALAAESD